MVKVEIRPATKAALAARRLYPREPYDEVIDRLLEDTLELSPETIRDLERARRAIAAGDFKTHEQVKKELGLSPDTRANVRRRARPAARRSMSRR